MRTPRRTALKAAALAAVTALATACGSAGDTADSAKTGAADDGWKPRTVTHAMGTTEIKKRPVRVMALDLSYVNATVLLETPVVGFTQYRTVGDKLPDYLGEPGKKYGAGAVNVGTMAEPSLEKIAAAKPDLIVSAKVRHEALYQQLSQIAPTIMSETTGPTWKENITMLASALGQEEVATKKLAHYEAQAKKVGDAINAKGGNPTISVVRFLDGPTRLYANKSFSGVVLKDAGLARPKAQDIDDFSLEISEEKIAAADGDKIFVTTYDEEGSKAGSTAKAKFKANKLWAPLAPKVVEVSDETWMTSVAAQGAYYILSDLAKTYGVPGPEPIS